MRNPFGQIVSFEDYVDIIGIPKEQLNSEEVKNRINKWLVQATEQFDSMISGNGQLGRLYRWFEALQDNEEDNYKKYKLIKAICSWVETFVIKGKFWVDGLPVINSNVDIQINSSSNDSNVEAKRKDIIQDLVSVGLYQTTNFGDNGTYQDNQQNAEQLIEDLMVLSTSELQQNYLRLNPQKSLEGNLDFANNDLVNGGNIIGSTQQARNNIQYYNIIDSTIDLNKNTIIGNLPQDPTTANEIAQINQSITNINQEQITQNTNISNNANEISAIKAKDIEQNNRLTQLEQETEDNFNEITNIKTKDQQQDQTIQSNTTSINANTNSIGTLNQEVATNRTNIQTNTNNITALDSRLVSVSGLLNQTIDGLRTLRPFKFVGLYDSSRTYMLNEMVSKDDKFYLSLEDNNRTTPPGDKWIVMENFQQVDLSEYPTKLEVDQIKTTLENNITSNTNNITTNTNTINRLNNEVVKIAGNQTIAGTKTFNNQIVANEGLTTGTTKAITSCNLELGYGAGVAYITPEDNSSKILKFGGRSGKGRFNLDFENQSRLSGIADPTANFHAANKQYVDNLNNQNVKLTGDQSIGGNKTFTQAINVPTPTVDTNAATKAYVDNAIANSGGSGGSIDTSNFATLNTTQTITGAKTFNNQVVIYNNGTPLILRAVNPGKIYMLMKGADDNANFSLGADSSNTSLEVNRGDLTIKTQQANKNIAFENAARIKFNRSVLEIGTEINAGFGGGEVKFIPEDNTTKTLQFYNANATDQRRFNLLVPEPTQANNPATKQYVDTAIAGINTSGNVPQQTLDQINNNTTNINNLQNEVNGQATSIGALQNQVNVNVNRIGTNTNSINQLNTKDTQNVKLTGIQTIEGQKTFNSEIVSNNSARLNGITNIQRANITDGTLTTVGGNNNSLVNKQYVDNKTLYRVVFSNTTVYSTNQTTTVSISNYVNSNSASLQSWMIQFDRQGNNGNTYEGTFNLNFILPEVNKATIVESNTYFNNSNKRFEAAQRACITIYRVNSSQLQLTFQLWDGSNRIKNVKLLAPAN